MLLKKLLLAFYELTDLYGLLYRTTDNCLDRGDTRCFRGLPLRKSETIQGPPIHHKMFLIHKRNLTFFEKL